MGGGGGGGAGGGGAGVWWISYCNVLLQLVTERAESGSISATALNFNQIHYNKYHI